VPRALSDLQLRDPEYVLVAVRRRGEWVFNPAETFRLEPGHILIVMASPQGLESIESRLVASSR
jgi:voltage-gated potassium channel